MIQHFHKDEIMGKLRQTGLDPNSEAWIPSYQKMVTAVSKGLSEEEEENYANIAQKWNQQGPPVELQRK